MSPTCFSRCPKFGRCHFPFSRAFRGSDGLPIPFPAFSEVRRMRLFFFRRFPSFGRSLRLSSDVFRVSDAVPRPLSAFSDRRPRYTLLYIRARGGYFPCEYCLFESIDHLRPLKMFYIMCSQVIYLSGLEGDAATFRYWLIITILIV